ncbi:MAG: hypothetical protein U9O65_01395 [Thermotogota bacterium]|nr:hypothetical protein [Thermotogota bacterium]
MPAIKVKRKKKKKGRPILILIIILALVIAGFYIYYMISRVRNSEIFNAESIDYLILCEQEESISNFYFVRTKKDKVLAVEIPIFASLHGNDTLAKGDVGKALQTIDEWLGINAEYEYYFSLDEKTLKVLSSTLGSEAEDMNAMLDLLSERGLKFFDYWKLGDFEGILRENNNNAKISSAAIAAFLDRATNLKRESYKLKGMTNRPIEIFVSTSSEPVEKIYIDTDSLNDLRKQLEEW